MEMESDRELLRIDVESMRSYVSASGRKQNALAEKAGMSEVKLSLILHEKRNLEASEYANLCRVLGVPMEKFLTFRVRDAPE